MVKFFENNKLIINMKISRYILAFSAVGLLCGATACSDLSEVNDRLDVLEGKVQVLETVIPALNQNIEALQALAGCGTINKVEEKDGVYTITLSNGETLTINQGAIGVANPPVMSLDKDGYWMVNYGSGAEYLLVDGQKVNATGDNGVTPVFGVDADGYWTVSYDGGKTYEKVLGADEKPVSAVPQEGADEYFADVVYDGKTFTIELKDGQKITLPVVPTFYFSIEVEGEQVLQAGETKIYPVKSEGVVSAAVVAKPAGVEVSLDDKSLTVRALGATKAVAADSRKDIAVLALSAEGFATIAKMQVSVEGVAVDTTPRAVVAAGEATSYTLAFSVALDNSEAYKYMLIAAGADAPSAETLLADGTQATATTLVLENLAPATEYALYVLPLGTEKNGAVATAKASTLAEAVPSVEVAAGAATASTLAFTVTLTDGTSYKYMVLAADAEAPAAETIKAEGTEATAAELTVEGLEAETSYVLYVLPINGGTYGEVVALAATTAEPSYANDYEKYMAGKDIVIANMTINKATYGDATLVTKAQGLNNNGVYFINSDVEGVTMNSGKSIIVIGNDPSKRSKVSRSGYSYLPATADEDYWVLSNIDFTITTGASYALRLNGSNVCEMIIMDNCSSNIPTYNSALTQYFYGDSNNKAKEIIIKDSEFLVEANGINNFLNFAATQTLNAITFDNNVFYSADITAPATSFTLISAGNTTVTNALINKNTFYGAYPAIGGGNIINCKSNNMTVTNNMFGLNTGTDTNNVFVVGGKISEIMNFSNNAYFKNLATKNLLTVTTGNAAPTGTNESISSKGISTTGWNPAEGKFVIHSSYGATR